MKMHDKNQLQNFGCNRFNLFPLNLFYILSHFTRLMVLFSESSNIFKRFPQKNPRQSPRETTKSFIGTVNHTQMTVLQCISGRLNILTFKFLSFGLDSKRDQRAVCFKATLMLPVQTAFDFS